jgi:sugar/nucleoside kinase (ribokinase family)
MQTPRISISGLTSVVSVAPPYASATCMVETPEGALLAQDHRPSCFAGPGAALLGGLLARLGFPADARMEWGEDDAARVLREAAAVASPFLRVSARPTADNRTAHCRLDSWLAPPAGTAVGHGEAFAAEDLPGVEIRSRTVAIWCYPPAMLCGSISAERAFAARMASAAEHGVTQVLLLDRPPGPRENGESWQAWLTGVLPYTDILCAQADSLAELMDPQGTRQLAEDGRLHDLPAWLTGGILHDLSGFLLAHGVGCVALGLRDEGVYIRTNSDSNRVAFVRKFAPDDQIAAHLATWTERDMLIPPFAFEPANRYSGTDALAAGMVGSLLRGLTPGEAIRMAAAVVAFAGESVAPLDAMDSWEVVNARVEGGWEQGHCRIDLSGWSDD